MVAGHNVIKNDKNFIQKLRDLKQSHSEVISQANGGLGGTYHALPDEEANVHKENQ
jgi:hypothetical protein